MNIRVLTHATGGPIIDRSQDGGTSDFDPVEMMVSSRW
jgi:hypothetical protein